MLVTAPWSRRVLGHAIALLLLSGRFGAPASAQMLSAPHEIDFFRSVVERLKSPSGPPFAVDLRPLAPSVASVTARLVDMLPLIPEDSVARAQIIREAGASTGDAVNAQKCPGWTVVLTDRALAADCPANPVRTVILAVSREGPARFPNGNPAHMAGVEPSIALRTVRVIVIDASPAGGSVTSWDYVFSLGTKGWSLVAQVPIYILE